MATEEQQAFGGKNDPLYEQAVALVRETKRPSISMIQRRLQIGYTRSSLMLEAMVGTVISEFSPKAKVFSQPSNAAPQPPGELTERRHDR